MLCLQHGKRKHTGTPLDCLLRGLGCHRCLLRGVGAILLHRLHSFCSAAIGGRLLRLPLLFLLLLLDHRLLLALCRCLCCCGLLASRLLLLLLEGPAVAGLGAPVCLCKVGKTTPSWLILLVQ